MKNYIDTFLDETEKIIKSIDRNQILAMAGALKDLKRRNGRLFILGIGGSAANASHAVNDFRKIADIETYAPTDNVSELTAWTNDIGFDVIFSNWLKTSRLSDKDALLIFSVGGGSEKTSGNLVLAMEYAKQKNAAILAIVSRNGGAALKMADVCILIPVISNDRITPHAESWQAVLWHLVVNAIIRK